MRKLPGVAAIFALIPGAAANIALRAQAPASTGEVYGMDRYLNIRSASSSTRSWRTFSAGI